MPHPHPCRHFGVVIRAAAIISILAGGASSIFSQHNPDEPAPSALQFVEEAPAGPGTPAGAPAQAGAGRSTAEIVFPEYRLTRGERAAVPRFELPVHRSRDDQSKKNVSSVERFRWRSALAQSGLFLGIQHGFRLLQPKTKRELGGPFIRDWGRSVKGLRGWSDGDNAFINYVAHSLQGSATGRVYVNNSDFARRQEFGRSKDYWRSRATAFAWSALWSTQFEIGPISEASIGNVGLSHHRGKSSMAWGDLVVTPAVGTGVLVGEDAIDKYVLKQWLERGSGVRLSKKIKFFRSILTPTTSFANLLRGKAPWKRDNR